MLLVHFHLCILNLQISFNLLARNLVYIRLKNIELLMAWKRVDTETTVSTDCSGLPDSAEVPSLEKYYVSGGLLVLLFILY